MGAYRNIERDRNMMRVSCESPEVRGSLIVSAYSSDNKHTTEV